MAFALAISIFFGLVAAIALLSCHACIRYGVVRWRQTRRELAAIGRASLAEPRPLRRPQEAFARMAA